MLPRLTTLLALIALPATQSAAQVQPVPGLCNTTNEAVRETIKNCSTIIDTGKTDRRALAIAYNNRAWAHGQLDEYDLAFRDYDRALQIDPDLVQALLRRAALYITVGQPTRSLPDYDRAVRVEPSNASARIDRGTAFQILGDYELALNDFRQAIRLDPGGWRVFYQRAIVFELRRQPEAAARDYDEILLRRPGEDIVYDVQVRRCRARLAIGQLDGAVADCNDSLVYKFVGWRPFVYRGVAMFRLGDLDRAIEDFQTALRRHSGGPEALFGLGVAQLRKGDTERGERNIAFARKQDPQAVQEMVELGLEP